jgi:hypothetical protein
MASRSQPRRTTDRDEMRQWAEARGGRPAVVKSTRSKGDHTEFCGSIFLATAAPVRWRKSRGKNSSKNSIEKNSLWSIRTPPRGGRKSNFNKIVSCETVTARAAGKRSASGKSSGGAAGKTGRKRTGPAAKKPARRNTGGANASAARRSTGRKAAKRASRSR